MIHLKLSLYLQIYLESALGKLIEPKILAIVASLSSRFISIGLIN